VVAQRRAREDNRLVDLTLLDRARDLGVAESGLAVAVTTRADGSAQASVVNAGVLDHPVTGEPVVGFVTRGRAKKLDNLRARPRATVVFRSSWEWVTVEGHAELIGPDDRRAGVPATDVLNLLRRIYAAAVGGNADDWAELDGVLVDEGHTAVLIRPVRIYAGGNE
jgi:PPOX class probable F420-dependent enzyme